MTATNKANSNWKAIGQRLALLRDIAHLERDEAAKLAGVARKTYKDWEIGVANLSEKRARWIISELQARGIQCSIKWLLTGVGEKPQRPKRIWQQDKAAIEAIAQQSKARSELEQQIILDELDYFCSKNPHSIGLIINDDLMVPTYLKDEVVAGVQRAKKKIATLIGLDCIIKLTDGTVLLRNLNHGRKPELYTLICSNRHANSKILYDQELISAAPVLWHRRLDQW